MNRREAIAAVAYLTGSTVIGANAFLSSCKPQTSPEKITFTRQHLALLDEVGEGILPATSGSPGAKAAQIGTFMQTMVTDCYEEKDQKIFMEGLRKLQGSAQQKYTRQFQELSGPEKHTLLVVLDKEAKAHQKSKKETDPNHYFTLMKQLTLLGYFSSQPGATQALRYLPVPGRFEGCIPYQKGEKAWAI
jgi:hypothetical protein